MKKFPTLFSIYFKVRGGRVKGSILIQALLGKYLYYISYYCELFFAALTYCHGCYQFSLQVDSEPLDGNEEDFDGDDLLEDGGELVEDGGEPILEQDIDQDEDYVPPAKEIKVVFCFEAQEGHS